MMSIRVNFEIGHEASIRSKRTPEGFTHDWEIFIRGCDSDPSHFIERVVFNLHETFQKPKRVIKEPPYSVKESGYAGFVIPIDIYLKNRDEPKKIQFKYDLSLQHEGPAIQKVQKEKYIFHNPSDEFKKKLLKGGGILVNSSIETDKIKENDGKIQLTGKPKLGADMMKKHKPKEHRSDEPKISSFAHLFGTPISTGSKASPDPKKTSPIPPKTISAMSISSKKDDRVTKDKNDKSKPKLSPSKEKDNNKIKDGQDKTREDKRKGYNKDRDRSKEKLAKTSISPKPKSPKHNSPSLPNNLLARPELDQQKMKIPENNDSKRSSETKDKKMKKEKKGHDREKKEHKREKEREKETVKDIKLDQKNLIKDKELLSRDALIKEKPREKEKAFPIKMGDAPKSETDAKMTEIMKNQEKREIDRKHKHKKKDKSRKDELKMDRDKDKKNKSEKIIKPIKDVNESLHLDDNLVKVDNTQETGVAENLSEHVSSDSEGSIKSIEEPVKLKSDVIINSPSNDVLFNSIDKLKDKTLKKHKDKSKNSEKEEKRRKRKSKEEHTEKPKTISQPPKLLKMDEEINSDMEVESPDARENIQEHIPVDNEPVSIESNDVADPISNSPSEDKAFTPDYMSELKELQHKIMTLQDNTEIQDIVQMVAETGQFEITKKTFDFDLCTLDRSTVQRLQEFFASS